MSLLLWKLWDSMVLPRTTIKNNHVLHPSCILPLTAAINCNQTLQPSSTPTQYNNQMEPWITTILYNHPVCTTIKWNQNITTILYNHPLQPSIATIHYNRHLEMKQGKKSVVKNTTFNATEKLFRQKHIGQWKKYVNSLTSLHLINLQYSMSRKE
jgi:hypothetical protein